MQVPTSFNTYEFFCFLVIGFLILMPFIDITQDSLLYLWFIPCYITGLVYHKLMENTLGTCLRNKKHCIAYALKQVGYKNMINTSTLLHSYYKAYYFLSSRNQLGNIPSLEAQLAFMRNLFPILLFYLFLSIIPNEIVFCKPTFLPNIFFISCLIAIFLIISVILLIYFWDWGVKRKDCYKIFLCIAMLCVVFFVSCICFHKFSDVTTVVKEITDPSCCCCKKMIVYEVMKGVREFKICVCLTLLLVTIIMPFLYIKTQIKIHYLVWEGYFYLSEIEEKCHSNNSISS